MSSLPSPDSTSPPNSHNTPEPLSLTLHDIERAHDLQRGA